MTEFVSVWIACVMINAEEKYGWICAGFSNIDFENLPTIIKNRQARAEENGLPNVTAVLLTKKVQNVVSKFKSSGCFHK